MSSECNREPTLWDTHEQVEMNKNTAKHLREEIEIIHQMLDKDVWADQRCKDAIPKNCSIDKSPTNNIRFETSQAAQETKAILEECRKLVIDLRYKIHTQEVKTCPSQTVAHP